VRERTFGQGYPETAIGLFCLANCDRHERRYASAEALFEQGLSLVRGPYRQYRVDAAQLLADYAAMLRETGRAARAAEIEAVVDTLRKGR
jgi:hypothetical protein